MRKCKHVYRARLHQTNLYKSIEESEVDLAYARTTQLVKVCTICGNVRINTYDTVLYEKDFVDSEVWDMFGRCPSMSELVEKVNEGGE